MSFEKLLTTVEAWVNAFADADEAVLNRNWAWDDYDSEGVRFACFRTYEQLRELAVRISAERLPKTQAQHILAQYILAYFDLQGTLLGIEQPLVENSPSADEWSVQETLKHIVGADMGFYVVVTNALEHHRQQSDAPLPKVTNEVYDRILDLDDEKYDSIMKGSFANLRSYHQQLHTKIVHEFANIDDNELELPALFWESEPYSLRFRLHRFDSHTRQHTIQIDKIINALNVPSNEGRRLMRLTYRAIGEVAGTLVGAWDCADVLCADSADKIRTRLDEIRPIIET